MYQWLERFCEGDPCDDIPQSRIRKWFEYIRAGNCYHRFEFHGFEYVCINCGLIQDMPQYVTETFHTMEVWPRNYARKQYFDLLLAKIKGFDRMNVSEEFREEFVADVPNPCDWYTVYQRYKAWDLKDWWIGWNFFNDSYGKGVRLRNCQYRLMLFVDEYWEDSTRAKKKLNVFYMMYKIVEMTKDNTDWIPMKLRSIAITRLDEEWKQICDKFNWPFVPSRKTLKKIRWC
jgi:hypothetical protein